MKNIFSFYRNRKFKVGALATTITVLFIVAVIIVNVVLNIIVEKFPLKVDLTQEKIYQLSGEALDYIKKLDKSVEIISIVDEATLSTIANGYISELYKNFQRNNSKITLTYTDAIKNPVFFKDNNITLTNDSIVVIYCSETKRYKTLGQADIVNDNNEFIAESSLTSAILYTVKDEIKNVHVLSGHNEVENAYLENFFKSNGFDIIKSDFLTANNFTDDSKILIINNPKDDFSESDINELKKFMSNNYKLGRCIYFFCDNSAVNLPNLYGFLEEYGIKVYDEMVVDSSSKGRSYYPVNNSNYPLIIATASNSDLTTGVTKPLMTFDTISTKRFEILFDVKGYISSVKSLLKTTSNAYTKPINSKDLEKTDTDTTGSFDLGVLSQQTWFDNEEQKTYNGYLAAFSSTSFADGVFLTGLNYGNASYLKNIVNYTTGDDSIKIGIYPKNVTSPELKITSASTIWTIVIITIILIPLTFLIISLVVFIKRKHL